MKSSFSFSAHFVLTRSHRALTDLGKSRATKKPDFSGSFQISVAESAACVCIVCTIVKDVRSLVAEQNAEFQQTLELIKEITSRMAGTDTDEHTEAA